VVLAPPPRPEPPVATERREVVLGEVRVAPVDEPMPDADVRGQFFASAQTMRGCWGARGARLSVDVIVAVSGSVVEARVEGDNEAAARCVQNALIGWRAFGSGEPLHLTADLVGEPAPLPPPEPDHSTSSAASPFAPPFDRRAAAAALGAVNLASCARPGGPAGSGRVSVTFGQNGLVVSAVVDQPPYAGTPTGECIARVFRGVRVPAFSGSVVKIGKSFSLP
jgi:hypothetical protein